jgi:hypothetical protein
MQIILNLPQVTKDNKVVLTMRQQQFSSISTIAN